MAHPISAEEFLAQVPAGWRADAGVARVRFRTGSFAAGLAFVVEVGALAEAANHHPDILLRYPDVAIELTTHDLGGLSSLDVDLARQVSDLAGGRGLAAEF